MMRLAATVAALATVGAATESTVPLFMWTSDASVYGGKSIYELETMSLRALPSVVLPDAAATLPEVVVAYVGDHLSRDEMADHVRNGRLSALADTLRFAASSKVAPYVSRPIADQGVGPLAAALAQLTNQTQPGGAFYVVGALSAPQRAELSSHVAGWRPVALADLPAADGIWSNGAVDVLAVFYGAAADADTTIAATEVALVAAAGGRAASHLSLLTAARPSAQRPSRAVHAATGGRRLLQTAEEGGSPRQCTRDDGTKVNCPPCKFGRKCAHACANRTTALCETTVYGARVGTGFCDGQGYCQEFIYGSSHALGGAVFFLIFVLTMLQAVCCLMDIQTPTQYWSDEAYGPGKLDE